jgi:hypothetical protein
MLPGVSLGAGSPFTVMPPTSIDSSQLPKVTLVSGDKKERMQASLTQIAKSELKGGAGMPGIGASVGSMSSMAASMAMRFLPLAAGPGAMLAAPMMIAMGLFNGPLSHHSKTPSATYVWALPGVHSAVFVPSATPKFEIEFGDIVGLDPDIYEPSLVKLTQTKDNWRLVGGTRDTVDKKGNEKRSAITEDRVEIKTTSLGRGHAVIEAASPLAAGEYGVVLHPVKLSKTGSANTAGLTPEQSIFYSVWDFSVPATETVAAQAHQQ